MFKICVVGCGSMAKSGHGPAFRKYAMAYPDTELSACCDLNATAAEEFRNSFGFQKAYTDYGRMLEEICPDAVSLLCPVAKTAEFAIDIIQRGYHIILEKPPGRNLEETRAIEAAAQAAKVFVRTAFNRRYAPLVIQLKALLGNEKIRNVTYQMYRKNRHDPDFATTSIHAIDAVSYIAGSPYQELTLAYSEIPENGPNVINIQLQGKLQNDALVSLSLIPVGGSTVERISVNTDKATYFAQLPFWNNPDSPGQIIRMEGNEITHRICGNSLVDSDEMFETSGFYEENRSFFDLIRSGTEPFSDLTTGMQAVEIADLIRNRAARYTPKEEV